MIKNLFNYNRKISVTVLLSLALVVLGLIGWWKWVYTTPENVFQAMLENNLRTTSVTKHIVQADDTQGLDQYVNLQAGAQHITSSRTVLTQQGEVTARVETERIGTPSIDYDRYVSIVTNQKNEQGDELDFSRVLNLWGKSSTDTTQTVGELYNESTLGVVPFGNLNPATRQDLLTEIHNNKVYQVDYSKVTKSTVDGRSVYTYEVKVMPEAYVRMLQQYAKAVGLTQLEDVDPAAYANAEPLVFEVSVDVISRRLSSVTFANGRQERYVSYGVNREIAIPSDTISREELQIRIQNIQ